jgi:hypothetical protein
MGRISPAVMGVFRLPLWGVFRLQFLVWSGAAAGAHSKVKRKSAL